LFKFLGDENNSLDEYEVLVNEKNINPPRNPEIIEEIQNSELMLSYNNLETIDILPSLSGSDKNILGIVLIVAAVALIATGIGAGAGGAISLGAFGSISSGSLIVAGLGLAASGALILLSKPPKFEPFGEIDQGQRDNYLFNGPVNTISEGGPVPLGYGELIVGSNVVAQNLQVRDYVLRDENDFNNTNSGIIIVDKVSQYDWAVNYINSEQYTQDLEWWDLLRDKPYAIMYNTGREQYQRLYWSKYFIYWYQVQQQVTSFLASDAPDQYSATIQG
jgi:predicted phage tail protein